MSSATFTWSSELGSEFTVPYDHTIATRPRFGSSCTLTQELAELEHDEAALGQRVDATTTTGQTYALTEAEQELLMRLRRLRHVLGKS